MVLLGAAAALTSCGAGPVNRADNSWGGDGPGMGPSNTSRSSSYYGSHYYGGYGNNYLHSGTPSSTPSTTTPSKDGVTRGGFGSKSSFHSSGS
ncbi:MAG: hypothetical protein JNM63_11485 [Spirochaetia bacterium]|nr:hypothetical protein [Spirochaetia bacterium]